jgi:hypothetical protein
VCEALTAAAGFGPYFTWRQPSVPASPEPFPGDGWIPWERLADGDVASSRVSAAREALTRMSGLAASDVPVRVVASVTFLGYASRIVSPLLAAAALGELPVPGAGELWWREVPGGPLPLAYAGSRTLPTTGLSAGDLARALTGVAVTGLLGELTAVFRSRFALSPHVLRGNVASALAGAAGMIAPAHAARATAVVAAMLRIPPLMGAAQLVRADPGGSRRSLVRNNCCLYYRIPGGGTCGDCILRSPPVRS